MSYGRSCWTVYFNQLWTNSSSACKCRSGKNLCREYAGMKERWRAHDTISQLHKLKNRDYWPHKVTKCDCCRQVTPKQKWLLYIRHNLEHLLYNGPLTEGKPESLQQQNKDYTNNKPNTICWYGLLHTPAIRAKAGMWRYPNRTRPQERYEKT